MRLLFGKVILITKIMVYSSKSPSFIATVTLDIGEGRTEWGAKKGENYYILKIHSIDELRVQSAIDSRKG